MLRLAGWGGDQRGPSPCRAWGRCTCPLLERAWMVMLIMRVCLSIQWPRLR